MISTMNYKIIYELFDHVIIFDINNKVVFEGFTLKRFLNNSGIDIYSLTTDKPDTELSDAAKLLRNTIEIVKSNLEPRSIKFAGIKDEYILFPLSFDFHPHVIITPKEKIIEITRIEHDLKERAKELRCLYNVSKELETPSSVWDSLEKCVKLVEGGFQFPGDTIINFEIGKKLFGNAAWDAKSIKSILISPSYRGLTGSENSKKGFSSL